MGKKFEFKFGKPVGEETVKVIATKEPLKLEDLGIPKFEQYFDSFGRVSVPASSRAKFVVKVNEGLASGKFIWGEESIVIRSHK